jgi:predicted AAA+ superfamily ATPase
LFVARDRAAKEFCDLYRAQHQEFPPECREADYERKLKAAYPIHPEIFDRLYQDWAGLVKFQRTRGVLRLMASVKTLDEEFAADYLAEPTHPRWVPKPAVAYEGKAGFLELVSEQ